MKHILLTLMIISPFFAIAQTFEIGINGGIGLHSIPFNNVYTHEDKSQGGYAASFKGYLMLPEVQIGIGVEMVSINEFNYLIPDYTIRQYNHLAKPLIVPHAFLNRMFDIGTGYAYAGLMLGPAIAQVGVNSWQYNGPFGKVSGYTTAYNSATGFAAGAQIGMVLNLNDRLGINAEAAFRYADFNYKDPSTTLADAPYHYKLIYVPITLGLRIRISS